MVRDQGLWSIGQLAPCLVNMHTIAITSAAAAGSAGFLAFRRWHQRWGATDAEVSAKLPGDDMLTSAGFTATRAITIAATPSQVWPWLLQVGFGRAGFYSYDLLDNLGRTSATQILPEFQSPLLGDRAAPMAQPANDTNSFRIAALDPPTTLVWSKPDSTWSWHLSPTDSGSGTRLVTRLRARYELTPLLPVTLLLMEIGDFPMMRKMLLGLRRRAEAAAHQDSRPR
jgi:hypothetical protein